METSDIKILLESFYNGDSTPEQEDALIKYFSGNDVAEDLIDDQKIFLRLYGSDNRIEVPVNLESDLKALIDNISQKDEMVSEAVQKKNRILLWAVSIAASLALIVSAGLYFNRQPIGKGTVLAQVNYKDTYSDPEIAYQEARKALMLVSGNLNKGIDQLSDMQENINKSNAILSKSLNHIK